MATGKCSPPARQRKIALPRASTASRTISRPSTPAPLTSITDEKENNGMPKIASLLAAAVLLSIASAGLLLAQQAPPAAGPGAGAPGRGGAPPPPFRIMSPDMVDGSLLPQQFTCAAGPQAVSPPLQWMNAPRGTRSFALIVHDMEPRPQKKLDDILHWMVWNIPATATKFPKGVPSNTADLPDGSHQTNGNPGQGGITGYRPPCPPQNVPLPHH